MDPSSSESPAISGSFNTPWIAAGSLLVALICLAFNSIWLVMAERELSPDAVIFDRLILATLVLSGWNAVVGRRGGQSEPDPELSPYTGQDWQLFGLAGVTFTTSLVVLGWALTQTSVANGTLLYNNIPVFTTLIAWLALGRQFSVAFVLGMVISLAGVALIGFEDFTITGSTLTGDLSALGAALLAAISLLCFENLRTRFAPTEIMMWVSLIGSILLIPLLIVDAGPVWPHSAEGWIAVVALAILAQSMGQGCLTFSLKTFSSGLVAVCMLSIPVMSAVLARLLFQEQLGFLNWLAFGIFLLGIYLAVMGRRS